MSMKPIGPVLQAWYQWKALRLPWRKRFLVGLDLKGNTYWEFRLARSDPTPSTSAEATPTNFRRIVQFPRKSQYSDVKVPPAWHQWLRYRRPDPPTLQEQMQDVARQDRMKVLAVEADRRWEAKERYIEDVAPPTSQQIPAQEVGRGVKQQQEEATTSRGGEADSTKTATKTTETQTEGETRKSSRRERKPEADGQKADNNPWNKAAQGGPSESWQPKAWNPTAGVASKRR